MELWPRETQKNNKGLFKNLRSKQKNSTDFTSTSALQKNKK